MAERTRLDAVVLDAGGTLIRLDFEWMAEVLAGLGHATDAATLRRGEVQGRRAYDASFGEPLPDGVLAPPLGSRGDHRAYLRGLLEGAAVPAALREPCVVLCEARQKDSGLWSRPMEGAREALDALVRMRLLPCVVSNSDGRAEEMLIRCGMREGLGFVVDSQIEGVEKPDPRLFQVALRRLGVEPGRALYVGDIRSVDEVGSRAAGMRFVLIDPLGDYGRDGASRIASIRELPEWITGHFEIPAGRQEPPASTTSGPARVPASREEP